MASKIGKTEWKVATAIAGLVDAVQWGVDLIPVFGEGGNAIADPFIGLAMIGYFWFRGINLFKKPQRVLAIVLGGLAEELTLEVLPAWIADVWYIHHDVIREEAADAAAQAEMVALAVGSAQQPFNEEIDGEPTRSPSGARNPAEPKPRVVDGIRPPNGGLGPE